MSKEASLGWSLAKTDGGRGCGKPTRTRLESSVCYWVRGFSSSRWKILVVLFSWVVNFQIVYIWLWNCFYFYITANVTRDVELNGLSPSISLNNRIFLCWHCFLMNWEGINTVTSSNCQKEGRNEENYSRISFSHLSFKLLIKMVIHSPAKEKFFISGSEQLTDHTATASSDLFHWKIVFLRLGEMVLFTVPLSSSYLTWVLAIGPSFCCMFPSPLTTDFRTLISW